MAIAFEEPRGGDRDPLLAALIGKLPREGEAWPREDREAWLNLMRAAFDIVYGREGAPTPLYANEAPLTVEVEDNRGRRARVPEIARQLDHDESAVAA